NIRDLRLPRLPAVPGMRAYDATTADKQSVERGVITGTRTVEQLLVPERTGAVEIPPLAMDVFDPIQKQYRTVRTEAIPLRISAAQVGQPVAEPISQNLLGGGGLRPAVSPTSGASRRRDSPVRSSPRRWSGEATPRKPFAGSSASSTTATGRGSLRAAATPPPAKRCLDAPTRC